MILYSPWRAIGGCDDDGDNSDNSDNSDNGGGDDDVGGDDVDDVHETVVTCVVRKGRERKRIDKKQKRYGNTNLMLLPLPSLLSSAPSPGRQLPITLSRLLLLLLLMLMLLLMMMCSGVVADAVV